MAVNISLTIDTAAAKQALNDINTQITQIKVNGAEVSIGGKKISQQMQQIGKAAEQAGAKTQRAGQKVTNSVISQVKTITQSFDKGFANTARNLFNTWSIIILVVQTAVKTFSYFFNNLTESIDKMTARGNTAIKMAQRLQQQADKKIKTSKDLVNQLIKLNQVQNLSIDQQRLGESVLARLNKQYKDLGITLDETTGKYKGVYQALIKLEQKQNAVQATSLKQQISAQRDVVNAALQKTFGGGISLDQTVKGKDFFGIAEALGGTIGYQNADLLAKKWNTKDLNKQIEVIEQLIGGLSSSQMVMNNAPEALEALNHLKDLRDELVALNSIDKQIEDANRRLAESFKEQADAIKKAKEQIAKLTQNYQEQQRTNSLAGLDPEDRANALRGEIEQLEKRNQLLKKAQQYGQKQNLDAQNTAQLKRKELDNLQDYARQLDEQIKKQQDTIKQIYAESSDPTRANYHYRDDRVKVVNQRLTPLKKQLEEVKKQLEQTEIEYENFNNTTLQYEQGLTNIQNQRQQNLNSIQQKQQQIADIEKQIEQARKKAEQEQIDRLQKQQDIINGIFEGYEQSQSVAYLKLIGQEKEALLLQAQLNAQKAKGAKLTEGELESLRNYVDVQQMIDNATSASGIKLNTNGVITNQLAQKGGFASSVVTDRAQDINKQILSQAKKQTDISTQIRNAVEKYSVIQ